MNRSKLLFSFSLINFVAVLICVLLMPSQVVIKFNSDMIVTDLFSRWFSIIIPTLQVVSCFVILFIDQKEQWKEQLTLKARTVIANSLNNKDENTAKWYLERKKKNEFGTRQEITGADGGSVSVEHSFDIDKIKQLKDLIGV